MEYIELTCKISNADASITEILISALTDLGFEGFWEDNDFVKAYIERSQFSMEDILQHSVIESFVSQISFDHQIMPNKNWNEEWEQNYFKPIIIADKCLVKASFHDVEQTAQYTILINPKMSFGTGHHETTSLMLEYLLETDCQQKNILDMGCGTGILGILASMLGAEKVTGIDIDDWAVDNAIENLSLNNIQNLEVVKGGKEAIPSQQFDIILANINRNILLDQIASYSKALKQNGILFLSGIYLTDLDAIQFETSKNGLRLVEPRVKNKWTAAKFVKR